MAVLVLSNMFLTSLLLQCETWTRTEHAKNKHPAPTIEKPSPRDIAPEADRDEKPSRSVRLSLDVRLGKWDSRRLFRTFDAVLVGERFPATSQASRVCLATQTSVEKLYSLVQVIHHWTGPISVALYAAGDEEFQVLQKYLTYLGACYEGQMERVAFSLAVPKGRAPKRQARSFEPPRQLDCAKPEATLGEMTANISPEQLNWRSRNIYPQNHMRNLARKNCQTEYVFLADVDIVPSENMSAALDEFIVGSEGCDKCVYVVPTYEVDARVPFPRNKSELVRLAKKGLARPFHQKVFINSQYATNFTR